MTSYAARARRTQTGGAPAAIDNHKVTPVPVPAAVKPALHSRKHSANSAGDVFAMLGQPPSSKVGSTASGREKQPPIKEESSSEMKNGGKPTSSPSNNNSPSNPSTTSLPATADDDSSILKSKTGSNHGKASTKRFKVFYSKPTLLKLWKSDLKVTAALDDLYSAFETPERQDLQLEGGGVHPKHYGSRNALDSSNHGSHDRPPRRERDSLGRLPPASHTSTGSARDLGAGLIFPANTRRTSSGSGFGPGTLSGVFQGGVLSGVGSASRKQNEPGTPSSSDFQRPPGTTRARGLGERDKLQTGSTPASAGWSSNRWRHLQADEDSHISSSGSSTKDENEEADPWSKPAEGAESEWRPGQHDRIEREKQALLRNQGSAVAGNRHGADVLGQASWRRREPSVEPEAQGVTTETPASAAANSSAANASASRPGLPVSSSNQSLFFDDLLGPTRQPTSVSSSRSNSIANSMSAMHINTDPLHSSASSRVLANSNSTPTRAAAAEGLEVLARRSPVQEMSMAALQQQRPMHTPPANSPHFIRPPPPPHPTNEPADRIFWQYRDPQGQLQGPFSVVQMQEWYGQGFFSDTLLVKRVESIEFETLGALIIRLHDVHIPFFSAPVIPNMYGPPPGMHAPGLSHPAFPPHAPSPVAWQQQQQQQQAQSSPFQQPQQQVQDNAQQQNASFSAGNAVFDLFSKAQQAQTQSPDTSFTAPPKVDTSASTIKPSGTLAHDPWSDMMPSASQGAGISRGSSALGGEPVEVESALFRRSVSGQHLNNIGSSALRQDSLPSPIGRSPSVATMREAIAASSAAKPVKQAASPTKQKDIDLPVVEGAVGAKSTPAAAQAQQKAAPASSQQAAQPASSQIKSSVQTGAPVIEKPVAKTAFIPAQLQASSAILKGAASAAQKASQAPAAGKSDGVSVVSQENFEKQKKGPTTASATTEVSLAPAPSPPSTAAGRKATPWGKPADEKAGSSDIALPKSTSGLSLREIQAKEQKEAEVRRAAEKKIHAAQRAAEDAALAERRAKEAAEGLPTTARWGDAGLSSPAVSTPLSSSPWAKVNPAASAKGAPAPKKTLKEIQEEEESRRRAAQQQQAQQAIKISKAYAQSAAAAPAHSLPDGSWQTVGNKVAASSSPAPTTAVRPPGVNGSAAAVRPAVVSSNSMASKLGVKPAAATAFGAAPSIVRSISSAGTRPVATSAPAAAVQSSAAHDDLAFPASADLLKWCKDALEGLKIPIDDFIQMLLSFPVPLDESTRELVSDSVYASSKVLDGHYFAKAFADKRLADTKAIKAGKATPTSLSSFFGYITPSFSSSSSSTRSGSMADAIKFIPAQKEPDFNFKVVTKSKGKRK